MWKSLSIAVAAMLTLHSGVSRADEPRRLELEVGGGMSADTSTAPSISARAAMDFGSCFSVGLRGVGVVGGRGQNYPQAYQPGFQAWAAFPELRLRIPWCYVQPFLAAGAGAGQLVNERWAATGNSPSCMATWAFTARVAWACACWQDRSPSP